VTDTLAPKQHDTQLVIDTLSPTQRRRLALGIFLGVIVALALAVGCPLASWIKESHLHTAQLYRRVSKARVLAADLFDAKRATETLAGSPVWQQVYRDPTPGAALSRLQTDVHGVLVNSGASAGLEPLETVPGDPLTQLGVRITMSLPADTLADVLTALAHAPRHLTIRSLSVVSPLFQHKERNEPLEVILEVTADYAPPPTSRS
jgi:hypothetical protein